MILNVRPVIVRWSEPAEAGDSDGVGARPQSARSKVLTNYVALQVSNVETSGKGRRTPGILTRKGRS